VATEVKQRNNRVVVLAGVVIALVAFGLSLYVSHSGSGNTSSSGQTVPVAVAKVDLLQGAQITSDDISIVPYPASQVPAGSSTDGGAVLNKFLAVGVSHNQPLTTNLLVADANSAKTAALTVQPLDIHPGYVAVAIPVDGGGSTDKSPPEQVSVGLWIQPEDHIDIIVDNGSGSLRYDFQDVRVLKVGTGGGSSGGTGGASAATVFVVELPRAQAEEMAFLVGKHSDGGSVPTPHIVSYVLRGVKDKGAGYLDDANPALPATKDQPVTAQTFNALFPSK
jgi:Flp pilus assembly protein CpaB